MSSKITVIIPAFNEEKNIERCVKSVLWASEIIILWMGNDETKKIASKFGTKVVDMKKTNQADFKEVQKNINWAIDNIKTDWILRIDADEVVTEELKKEIQKVINYKLQITDPVAYGVLRSQYFWGGFLKGGDWAYDRLIRFFRPKYCRYQPIVSVHEQFKVTGKVGYLQNKLLHFSHPTLKDAVEKFHRYTDVEINDLQETKVSALIKVFFRPPYVFFRWFVWHQGFKDGIRGIVAGLFRGWYEYLLYSKYLRK